MSVSTTLRTFGLLLAIVQTAALAQPAIQHRKLTHKQLKNLTASAKTPGEHETLAAYYHAKAQHFWAKYQKEEAALAEYYKDPERYRSKYPTEGDTARGLASYYESRAEKAAALENLQEKLAHRCP